MMVIYMDDCIIAGKDLSQIESAIEGISAMFEIAGEGEMDEYLGVKVEHMRDGSFITTTSDQTDPCSTQVQWKNQAQRDCRPIK